MLNQRGFQKVEANCPPFIAFPTDSVDPREERKTSIKSKPYQVYSKNLFTEWENSEGDSLL